MKDEDKKLLLEEIQTNMFVKNITDANGELIFFVTHKGKNDPKELYGWSIHEIEKEPAKLLVKSSHWIYFCKGDADYYCLLDQQETEQLEKKLMTTLPGVLERMTKIIKKS